MKARTKSKTDEPRVQAQTQGVPTGATEPDKSPIKPNLKEFHRIREIANFVASKPSVIDCMDVSNAGFRRQEALLEVLSAFGYGNESDLPGDLLSCFIDSVLLQAELMKLANRVLAEHCGKIEQEEV